MAKGTPVTDFPAFDFAGLMAMGTGPRAYQNQALYSLFPKTAAAYAGVPAAGYGSVPLSQSALVRGATGVAKMSRAGTTTGCTPGPGSTIHIQ